MNDDERRDERRTEERANALNTALGGTTKLFTRPNVLNTALDAKIKSTGGDGVVMGGANPRPSGAVLGGSSAAQLSARRLERHGVRMEMRKVSAQAHCAHHGAQANCAHHGAQARSAQYGVHARSAQGGRRPACTCSPRRPLLPTGAQARSAKGGRRWWSRWWSRCSTRRGRWRSARLPRLTGRPPGGEAPPDAGPCECASKGRLVNR